MARMRHGPARWLPPRRQPSPRNATGSHVASAVNQVRSPTPNPHDRFYPSRLLTAMAPSDFVWVRAVHMLNIYRGHQSRSRARWCLIHLHLKTRAHEDFFGTRVCRVGGAWLGRVQAWAGGRAHVAAAEGSRAAVCTRVLCAWELMFCNVGSPRARARLLGAPTQWREL